MKKLKRFSYTITTFFPVLFFSINNIYHFLDKKTEPELTSNYETYVSSDEIESQKKEKYNKKLESISLPEGFKIEIYASNVPDARSMTLGDKGTLFVGTRGNPGVVYAVINKDNDCTADEVIIVAKDLFMPNGVAFNDGDLYVAEVNRIIKFENIESDFLKIPEPIVVNDSFPDEVHHGWKFIAFGPDDKLYIPVGAPCNVCDSKDERFGSIMSMDKNGSNLEIIARGIRNTVGFDWHPENKELWFTENGRDWMGDDVPPDELNKISFKSEHFGFPYFHGNIPDPQFSEGKTIVDYTSPKAELGAHVAALGMRFYDGEMFPGEYKNKIFIAEHGSWNRADPTGYRIIAVSLKGENVENYEIFAEGWLEDEKAWGRPVDVQIMNDGALLVSDDKAGLIYRISY